jgi:hypothetical protein
VLFAKPISPLKEKLQTKIFDTRTNHDKDERVIQADELCNIFLIVKVLSFPWNYKLGNVSLTLIRGGEQ